MFVLMFIKRFLEILVSIVALLLLSPLFLAIAGLIKLDSHGSIFFRQPRVGWQGRVFVMYKFRTLFDPRYTPLPKVPAPQSAEEAKFRRDHCCEECGFPRAQCKCVTRVGRFLRKTSLDELPQLWNVLRGDMAFVGPRPTLPEQVEHYSERQHARFNAKPGITGLAQVSGRNALTWDQKIELDVWYVENRSLWLDCKILLQTLAGAGQGD
jgi:lipopolysaccharide/colanic/teichoic acid biosynthesis glycosyltransferase